MMMNCFPLKFQQAESDKQKYLPQQGRCQSPQQQFARSRAALRRRKSALAAATRHSGYGAQSPRQRQTNQRTNEGTELDENEDENGTYEDEKMYTRKGKSRNTGTQLLLFIFVDIEESEDE